MGGAFFQDAVAGQVCDRRWSCAAERKAGQGRQGSEVRRRAEHPARSGGFHGGGRKLVGSTRRRGRGRGPVSRNQRFGGEARAGKRNAASCRFAIVVRSAVEAGSAANGATAGGSLARRATLICWKAPASTDPYRFARDTRAPRPNASTMEQNGSGLCPSPSRLFHGSV